ncbi:MAG TPA: hypothetical protein VH231_09310 [Solirubrobacteraceae bacterium]|jgi:hypothetical protein|nr:hypothetical protein [Solirubrobacteraceae bacterium]
MTDTEPADTRLARILHGYAPAQIGPRDGAPAGLGLVTLDPDDWVSLTEMGAQLRSGTPGSLRDLAL